MARLQDPAPIAPMLIGSALAVLSGTLLDPRLAAIGCGLRIEPAHRPWIMAAYLAALGIVLPFGGALGDRVGRRRALRAGLLAVGCSCLFCGIANSSTTLLAGRIAQGAATALVLPNVAALLADLANGRRLLPLYAAGCTAATTLGPLLGGVLSDCGGWRWLFVDSGVAVAASWLFLDADGTPSEAGAGAMARSGRGFARPGVTLLLTLYTAAIYGTFFTVVLTLPADLAVSGRYTVPQAGFALLPLSAVVVLAGPLLQRWGERHPPAVLLALAPTLAILGLLALALAHAEPATPYAGAVLPATLLVGSGMALASAPLTVAVVEAAGPARAAFATGVNSAAARLGGAATVMIHGAAAGGSVELALAVASALLALLLLRFTPVPRRAAQPEPLLRKA